MGGLTLCHSLVYIPRWRCSFHQLIILHSCLLNFLHSTPLHDVILRVFRIHFVLLFSMFCPQICSSRPMFLFLPCLSLFFTLCVFAYVCLYFLNISLAACDKYGWGWKTKIKWIELIIYSAISNRSYCRHINYFSTTLFFSICYKKLSYRRETARHIRVSF